MRFYNPIRPKQGGSESRDIFFDEWERLELSIRADERTKVRKELKVWGKECLRRHFKIPITHIATVDELYRHFDLDSLDIASDGENQ